VDKARRRASTKNARGRCEGYVDKRNQQARSLRRNATQKQSTLVNSKHSICLHPRFYRPFPQPPASRRYGYSHVYPHSSSHPFERHAFSRTGGVNARLRFSHAPMTKVRASINRNFNKAPGTCICYLMTRRGARSAPSATRLLKILRPISTQRR
jgi:hypothetical protein